MRSNLAFMLTTGPPNSSPAAAGPGAVRLSSTCNCGATVNSGYCGKCVLEAALEADGCLHGGACWGTWTLGLERAFGGLTADGAYVGTSAFRLPRMSYPNAYPGADSEFARFTNFDSSGAVTGGFGFESVLTGTSHSSYNALQTSLSGNVGRGGPSLQAGYTWGKSLDDVSGILGGTGSTGAVRS